MSSKIKIITQKPKDISLFKISIQKLASLPPPHLTTENPSSAHPSKEKHIKQNFMHLCYNIVFQRLFNSCCVLDFTQEVFETVWKKI